MRQGFDQAIEEQRNRARKTGGFEQETARPAVAELAGRVGATKFIGYDRLGERESRAGDFERRPVGQRSGGRR